jgi:hypothetical protein
MLTKIFENLYLGEMTDFVRDGEDVVDGIEDEAEEGFV